MRVLVVGATGAIGTRLVLAVDRAGSSRDRDVAVPGEGLSTSILGAEAVTLDVLDPPAVKNAVLGFSPRRSFIRRRRSPR